jgi:hypothetical protein
MRRDVIHVTCHVSRVSPSAGLRLARYPGTVGCEQCGTNILCRDRHDAYFCPTCDAWVETACSDPSCTTALAA